MKFKIHLFFAMFSLFVISCQNDKTEGTSDNFNNTQLNVKNFNTDSSQIVIAFYNQDSIAVGFDYYRKIDSTLKEKEKQFESALRSKYENYQKFEQSVSQRMQNGEITGMQLDELQKEAMSKQQAIALYEQQRGTELQEESIEYTKALMNKISEAGKEFSEKKGIDIFYYYQKGGQITYISQGFDLTNEFIDFLNERENELFESTDNDE